MIVKKENHFEQDLNDEEYLNNTNTVPSSQAIDNMDRVFCKSTILKKTFLHPVNTFNYQPLQGA